MFNQAFYSRIEAIFAEIRSAKVLSMAMLGTCLGQLQGCLEEAEVRDPCVTQLMDLALDRIRRSPGLTGGQLADELCALLEETPGLGWSDGAKAIWSDRMPYASDRAPSRWDVKELDNRLTGFNRASVGRLRNAMGLTSDRPLRVGADLRHRRHFRACSTMQVTDQHDAAINGEQVNRLIRYLGWGDSDSDPRGGRHAILG